MAYVLEALEFQQSLELAGHLHVRQEVWRFCLPMDKLGLNFPTSPEIQH